MRTFKALRGAVVAAGLAMGLPLLTASGAFAASSISLCVGEKAGQGVKSGGTTGICPKPTEKVKYTKVALPSEESEQQKLLAILPYIKYVASGVGGKPTIQFSGVNLQVVNGEGRTTSANGAGNLVIGYDENQGKHEQSGSHDLILGAEQTFTSYGGILAGRENTITAPFAEVLDGFANTASGEYDAVSAGNRNTATGTFGAWIGGGWHNTSSGSSTSVTGGAYNNAGGENGSVSGGEENTTSGLFDPSVSGGDGNTAGGFWASVSGGEANTASGCLSSISGGSKNVATGCEEVEHEVFGASSVTGGISNTASGTDASVTGGQHNKAEGRVRDRKSVV
jgi:trimeric autotransporter adhesin